MSAAPAFEIVVGTELTGVWEPPGGQPKYYCVECGGHLFSGAQDAEHIFVRLGAIEGDPGSAPNTVSG